MTEKERERVCVCVWGGGGGLYLVAFYLRRFFVVIVGARGEDGGYMLS